MPSSLEIRPALQDDLEAILALYAELEPDGRILDLSDAERLFARMKQYPNYRIYVAQRDEKIVGTFSLLIIDNIAHLGAPSAIVEDVIVCASHQRSGIGRRMMQFAMEKCREAGCYKLALSSNIRRESAHKFYEALSFERHGYSFIVSLAESHNKKN